MRLAAGLPLVKKVQPGARDNCGIQTGGGRRQGAVVDKRLAREVPGENCQRKSGGRGAAKKDISRRSSGQLRWEERFQQLRSA